MTAKKRNLPALLSLPKDLIKEPNRKLPVSSGVKPPVRVNRPKGTAGGRTKGTTAPTQEPTTPGRNKYTGRPCKYGVRPDGFCSDAPPRVTIDSQFQVRKPVKDSLIVKAVGFPTGGSSVGSGAVATATGTAVGIAGGSAVAAIGKQIAGYIAANAALRLGGKAVLFLVKKTPLGRAANVGFTAFQVARIAQAGSKVKAAEVATKLLKAATGL